MRDTKSLLMIPLLFMLSSCFDQFDELTIYKSGKIELSTLIVVDSDDVDKAKVKEEIAERVKWLKGENWNVTYKWIKKSKPFKIRFNATNTVQRLYEQSGDTANGASGIDVTRKLGKNSFSVDFTALKDASSRAIKFTSSSLPLYIAENNKLKPTRTIELSRKYYLILDNPSGYTIEE